MMAGSFTSAFFIGGMDGVEREFEMFRHLHPGVPMFPIASTGAAAARLFNSDERFPRTYPQLRDEISYLTLMRSLIAIPNLPPSGNIRGSQ
jgi:hypothetical protein